MDDLAEQNEALRRRVAELEEALKTGTDPILRALSEHAAEFLNVVTPDGRSLATGRASETFGSVVGRSVFEFLEPQCEQPVRAVFARVAATGRPETYESIGYGEDGTTGHTYLTRVVPLQQADGSVALLLVPTDITDRVRLERSLAEQEGALRLAIQASRMGLWRWDTVSQLITWDERLRELWGVAATPASYEEYMALVHPDDRSTVDEVVREALATGVYRTFEHRTAARPGVPMRWVLASGSVRREPDGRPRLLMGGVLDVTEQKLMTERLGRAERVETIGQLTAGIAHNFNNLLAAIVPNIELSRYDATPEQQACLSAALDASLQARDVVRNLMSLTQRGARSREAARPSDIVPRVVGICRMTFPREISVNHHILEEVGPVALTVTDLEQVLLNLLFNARDAVEAAPSPGAPREVTIEVDFSPDALRTGAQAARLRIRDTGIGMSPETQSRIFEPFFTTKPPHKGSGLGLANVAERLRESSGTIQCDSVPGGGTTFTVLLPLQAPGAAETPGFVDVPLVGSGETILVVDDEALIRVVLRRMLESDGYVVLDACSAAEARTLLAQKGGQVQLIILDESMPRETGLEALPSLRHLTRCPVVLYTGMAHEIPSGVAALLEKPARPSELLRLVHQTLANAARNGALHGDAE